jgi:hypothetical protein
MTPTPKFPFSSSSASFCLLLLLLMYRLCPQSGQNRRNNLRHPPHKPPSITSPRQSFHVCALYCGHVEAQMPNNTGLCERGEGGREERECPRVTDESGASHVVGVCSSCLTPLQPLARIREPDSLVRYRVHSSLWAYALVW